MSLLLSMGAASGQTAPAPASEQAAPAPKKGKLAPRRPTRQIVGAPLPIVTEGYRPSLYPPATASGMPDPIGTLKITPTPPGTSLPGAPPVAPLPVPVTSCAGASCIGADGVRYNGGVGAVTVDPSGRACHVVANTVQCF